MILPLNLEEWQAVFLISFPVIVIDEVLKCVRAGSSELTWRRLISRTLLPPQKAKLE